MHGCIAAASRNIDAFKAALFPTENTYINETIFGALNEYRRFIKDFLKIA